MTKDYVYEYPGYRLGVRVKVRNGIIYGTLTFGYPSDLGESALKYLIKDAEYQAIYDNEMEMKYAVKSKASDSINGASVQKHLEITRTQR